MCNRDSTSVDTTWFNMCYMFTFPFRWLVQVLRRSKLWAKIHEMVKSIFVKSSRKLYNKS